MSYDLACTITGANGFVGRHLCRALMMQELFSTRVFAVDMVPESSRSRELHRLEGSNYFTIDGHLDVDSRRRNTLTYHQWDVKQPLHSAFLGVDVVYHFAGIANPKMYLDDPIRVMDLNLKGLTSILEKIVLWDDVVRPRIVYSSTSEVYGKNPAVPFNEKNSDLVYGPTQYRRWCYAMSKAVGEHYLQAYEEKHRIKHTIFRFFNFVGADIDAPGNGRAIVQMVGDALETGIIRVTEPGTQTRCFVGPDDFVQPLMRAMFHDKAGIAPYAGNSHIINLGSDAEVTMLELATMIVERLRMHNITRDVKIEITKREEIFGQGYDDIPRRVPDGSEAERLLGWKPSRSSREAVVEAIEGAIARCVQAG